MWTCKPGRSHWSHTGQISRGTCFCSLCSSHTWKKHKNQTPPGQLEMNVREITCEHLLIIYLIDSLKMSLDQVCEIEDVVVVVFIDVRFWEPCPSWTKLNIHTFELFFLNIQIPRCVRHSWHIKHIFSLWVSHVTNIKFWLARKVLASRLNNVNQVTSL